MQKPHISLASITATSFLIPLCVAFFISLQMSVAASYNVSAVFAFRYSTMDAGNNNHFNTPFRGDHLPYGCDLPHHVPTGRFSNGMLSTDYLVQFLGLKDLLPAYLNPAVTDHDLLTRVTFASAGSGLDNQTNALTIAMGLSSQFVLFEEVFKRIATSVGEKKGKNIVESAIFVISVGTNDLLFNAYLVLTMVIQYGNVSGYHDFLLQNLEYFIQRLYRRGARRIIVTGLPPIGCLPLLVTVNSILPSQDRACNARQNRDCEAYNTKLQSQIQSLQARLNGAKVGYFDIYRPILDMVLSPAKYEIFNNELNLLVNLLSFQETLRGCCGTGLFEVGPACNVLDLTCKNAIKYLFWDAVHPTQAGYSFLAQNDRQTVLPYVTS